MLSSFQNSGDIGTASRHRADRRRRSAERPPSAAARLAGWRRASRPVWLRCDRNGAAVRGIMIVALMFPQFIARLNDLIQMIEVIYVLNIAQPLANLFLAFAAASTDRSFMKAFMSFIFALQIMMKPTLSYSRFLNRSGVNPTTLAICPIVMALTGLWRGMVTMRPPSLITICLPCRIILKPTFL